MSPPTGQIITFYSYKGGTGRSMAVANVACLLARKDWVKRGVLVVDWDLEAPGQHRYFAPWLTAKGRKAAAKHPGLIDLFESLRDGLSDFEAEEPQPSAEAAQMIDSLKIPQKYILSTKLERVSLLQAGRHDPSYTSQVVGFDWNRLHLKSPSLMLSLGRFLARHYDFVLIDSRTGMSDTSSICTALLPEKLVVAFTPNVQSLTGVRRLVSSVVGFRRSSSDIRPLVVFPLLCRIDFAEQELSNLWREGGKDDGQEIEGYEPLFEELFREVYGLKECSLERYFREVNIQHVPYYSFGEKIAVEDEKSPARLSLSVSFENFTDILVNLRVPWEDLKVAERREQTRHQIGLAEECLQRHGEKTFRPVMTRFAELQTPEDASPPSLLAMRAISVPRSEFPSGEQEVLDEMLAMGLLQLEEVKSDEPLVRLADTDLMQRWGELVEWLEEEREFLRWKGELKRAFHEWRQSQRTDDQLLSGALLEEAGQWYPSRRVLLAANLREYIEASLARTKKSRTKLLDHYLTRLVAETSGLDLAGVDPRAVGEREEAQLQLAAVYTALDTIGSRGDQDKGAKQGPMLTGEPGESRRESALAFVNRVPAAVLLGDPGSGKTTFANFLALCLAGESLGLEAANLELLGEEWTCGELLPIRVVLRQFAVELRARGSALPALRSYLKTAGAGQAAGQLLTAARQGKALLILDGLDEVPEGETWRGAIREAVIEIRRSFKKLRVLLTSRTYAYLNREWQLPDFEAAILAPFSDEQITTFIERWYRHLSVVRSNLNQRDAQGQASQLKEVLNRSPHLTELARRPLLLTLMASLHAWRGGTLPEQREQLYEESIELLLDIWERPKTVLDESGAPLLQTETSEQWFGAPRQRILEGLEELAFQVHREQEKREGSADITEQRLVDVMIKATSADQPERVVSYIRDRAGLLTHRGPGVYSFPHRTFQEYLAARYLTRTRFPGLLVQLVQQDPERWQEVLLLAGLKVARGTPFAAWSLVERLCPEKFDPAVAKLCQLSGRLLADTGIYREITQSKSMESSDLYEEKLIQRVQSVLLEVMRGDQLPARDRADAGVCLGKIGDTRQEVLHSLEMGWVLVPSGTFTMGSSARNARDDEKPSFKLDIPYPYRISRFPVTNAQFAEFVESGGYEEKKFWVEAFNEGIWRAGKIQVRTWFYDLPTLRDEKASKPADYGDPVNLPNHPVVGVSWYEALAYCRWLTGELRSQGLMEEEWQIDLPSEAEWEKAARGMKGAPHYPWGRHAKSELLNALEAGIGATSAVGCFAAGASPYGAEEMSGNVWEWTRSPWGQDLDKPFLEYPLKLSDFRDAERDFRNFVDDTSSINRVLRGGSFYNNAYALRCYVRGRESPSIRVIGVGFRLCCLPVNAGE